MNESLHDVNHARTSSGDMDWLTHQIPVFGAALAVVVVERLARAPRTDWLINLAAWVIYLFAGITVVQLVRGWQGASLIDGAQLPGWLAVVLFILVYDLAEYMFHRMQHKIPLLWAMHSLHHSDPEMSALTTSRHFWAEPLFKTITVWSVAAMIITPTPAAIAVYATLSLWNFITHSRLKIDLGRWSWLINSPAYHRRHHSSQPAHFNSNFAALFPIWDVISGSYHRPDGFPPTGLEVQPRSVSQLLLWPLYYRRNAD